MRPIKYIILLFVVVSFVQNVTGQSVEEKLIGTWVLDYDTSISKMKLNMKAHFDTIPQLQRRQIVSVYRGRQVTYMPNGHYEQVLADGRKSIGTWALSSNKNTIEITDPRNKVHAQVIKRLNNTLLIITIGSRAGSKALISELYFIKRQN